MKNEIRSRSTVSRVGGSAYWMAPELTGFQKKITKANDVFSFAVLLTEVISWIGVYGVPLHEMDPSQFPSASKDDVYHREALANMDEKVFTAINYGDDIQDLFQQCWQVDPAARPLFPQIASTLELLLDGFGGTHAVASSVATLVIHTAAPAAATNLTMPKPINKLAAQRQGSLGYYSEGYMAQTLTPSSNYAGGSAQLSLRPHGDSAHQPLKPSPQLGPADEILTDLALTHPDIVKFWRHWAVEAATGKTAFQIPWSELAFALEAPF
ncbi:hypothetical protein DFJ73DRAFT_483053 [Zopfochytrium polystomum]|nr:hypothetical protein DFJ73DRAFT_483053 [Zopfochytrium polystomum]